MIEAIIIVLIVLLLYRIYCLEKIDKKEIKRLENKLEEQEFYIKTLEEAFTSNLQKEKSKK